ncbi:hypothetical protein [Lederbergia lenta]|uniref:hypothetical protein n=1 Tax=Lederbergia lenta TaxID=1467 RepID=UPI00203CE30A|nr:hypothetical protein [Lederbergia lenta]MCM3110661.1 hypothetical protein [Lederbergia lenta]
MDKELDKLQVKLRNEMSMRMDDRDIVEILEVLQGAEETIEKQQNEIKTLCESVMIQTEKVEEQQKEIESFQNLKEILEEANHGMSAKVEEQQKELERREKFIENLQAVHFAELQTEKADNARLQKTIKSASSELNYALYSNKSDDVKRFYTENAKRYLDEVLAGEPSCQSKN